MATHPNGIDDRRGTTGGGDSKTEMSEELDGVRRDLNRAVRRLSVMEYVILLGIVALSLAGGALLALLVEAAFGFPFRTTWIVASILFFVLPGAVILGRERLGGNEARSQEKPTGRRDEDDV